jgi:hypothetical protein
LVLVVREYIPEVQKEPFLEELVQQIPVVVVVVAYTVLRMCRAPVAQE